MNRRMEKRKRKKAEREEEGKRMMILRSGKVIRDTTNSNTNRPNDCYVNCSFVPEFSEFSFFLFLFLSLCFLLFLSLCFYLSV